MNWVYVLNPEKKNFLPGAGAGAPASPPVSTPDGNGLKDQYADGNVLMEPSRRKNASE